MKTYYTPYELVQRLDAIPTVSIRTFTEPILEDDTWTAQVTLDFPNEFDMTAYKQVESVIRNASNWSITKHTDDDNAFTRIEFEIEESAPTKLLAKFDLS